MEAQPDAPITCAIAQRRAATETAREEAIIGSMTRCMVAFYCVAMSTGLALLGSGDAASACDTVSCSLAARGPDGGLAKGSWRVDLSFRSTDQSRRLYGHDALHVWGAQDPPVVRPLLDFDTGLVVPGFHQEYGKCTQSFQLDVAYGVTKRLMLIASVPTISDRRVEHLFIGTGAIANHQHANTYSARVDYATRGLADAQLTARFRVSSAWTVGVAVQFPTGRIDFRDEYGRIADPMLQLGSGAAGLIMSASFLDRSPFPSTRWSLQGSYQRNTTSDRAHRFGDEAILIPGINRGWGRVTAILQAKGHHLRRNTFNGRPTASTGATIASLIPALVVRGPAGTAISSSVVVPVFQHVNEQQLALRTVLTVGVSITR